MHVAILTDFGYRDPYVGIMKGVMTDVDPAIRFIDLTHGISPFDLRSAGYALLSAWPYLPPTTTVLAVVDPGVGSARRELIVSGAGKAIVAPDNGLISMLALHAGPLSYHRARDQVLKELAEKRPAYAHTFDGRDLFAPLAARIASTGHAAVAGEGVEPVVLPDLRSESATEDDGPVVRGSVVHIDTFGNVVTTVPVRALEELNEEQLHVEVRGESGIVTANLAQKFADAERGEPVAYIGSAGFLEIAAREGDLAAMYEIGQAAEVFVRPARPSDRAAP